MATLISQNVMSKDRLDKSKRKAGDDPPVIEGPENIEDGPVPEADILSKGKRKKKQSEAKQIMEIEQEMEMMRLQNFLFGSLYSPVKFGNDEEDDQKSSIVDESSAMFFVDRTANSALPVYEEDAAFTNEISDDEESEQRKPVWIDDEEEKTAINIAKVNRLRKLRKEEGENVISGSAYVSRLRAQHIKLNPGTEWAQLGSREIKYASDDEDLDEGVDDILRTNEDLVVKSGTKLLPGLLEYSRLVDANAEEPSNGLINSVQFHRNAQLLLAGGLDKKLRFFQIDGKRNTKIQSIFLDDCPIRKAAFLPDGSQVIVAGRRKFFYCFNLVKAKVDRLGLLTGREEKSLEVFEVSPDSKTIAFLGNEGYILLVSW